jgi:hypothetical protein
MKMRFAWLLLLAMLPPGLSATWAADAPHGMYTPGAIKWGPAPPNLPKGSQIAVLYGDPAKEGLYVIQAKLPADYRIPAHSHPGDEVLTVLSGTLLFGMGDKLDPERRRRSPSAAWSSRPPR